MSDLWIWIHTDMSTDLNFGILVSVVSVPG